MRRATRLKIKLIQAPPGSPRGAFSFVGRYTHHTGLCPTGSAPTPITSRLIRKAEAVAYLEGRIGQEGRVRQQLAHNMKYHMRTMVARSMGGLHGA